jgi:hypothetical protein
MMSEEEFLYIPDKATTSVTESPTFWNFLMILESESFGAGRAVLGRVELAVVLSRLPNCTVHDGPLDCSCTKGYIIVN